MCFGLAVRCVSFVTRNKVLLLIFSNSASFATGTLRSERETQNEIHVGLLLHECHLPK